MGLKNMVSTLGVFTRMCAIFIKHVRNCVMAAKSSLADP